MSTAARKRASAATRRYRARLRAGEIIAPTPVSHDLIDYLLWLGPLTAAESESRADIGRVIRAILDDTMAQDEQYKSRIR